VLLSGSSTSIVEMAVSPGSDRVAFTAFAGGLLEVWVAGVLAPSPVKVSTPSASGRAEQPRFTADGSRVLYREGPNGGFRRLWSAPADGSAAATPLSDAADNCSRFGLAADGVTVIFHADQPDVGRSELFVAPVDGSAPPQTLSLFPGDPDVNDEELMAITDWQLTPDRTRVVYVAQRHWPDDPGNLAIDLELYAVAAGGPSGSEMRLDLGEPPEQRAYDDRTEAFALSPDGSSVVFLFDRSAELPDDRIPRHLFAVPIDRSAGPVELATAADHVFSLAAAAAHAIYLGGDTTLADSLRSVPLTGGGFVTLDGDPVSSRQVLDEYLPTPDGDRVVYPVGAERALWAVAADGAGGPVELTPWLGFSGDVQSDFQITAGATSVLYRSDFELDGLYELYSSPVAGGGSVKLNDPPITGRRVFAVSATLDERCVVFTAESSSSAPRRLFAADLHGVCAGEQAIFADGFESGNAAAWSSSSP
jgi:hypothetical protein